MDHSQVGYLGVGARRGRGCKNTTGLKPTKYREVINGPDGKAREEEIVDKYTCTLDKGVLQLHIRKSASR